MWRCSEGGMVGCLTLVGSRRIREEDNKYLGYKRLLSEGEHGKGRWHSSWLDLG